MSGNNENNGPNWLGLLRWSVAYSDGTTPSNATAMSEEDKQWLERVMKEGVRDDVQRMNEIMTKVKNSDFTDIEMELEDLKDIVEQVDMAQVFTKCGGCEVLLQFIEERVEIPPAIRALAASVIATVAQNNLIAQDAMMSAKVVDKLAALFLDTSSDLLATKILYALSCTVRGHAAAEEHFSLILSEAIIAKVLQTRAGSIVSRAAFLTNALITSDYCTNNRINKFVHAFLPGIFELLTSENQADGRDQIYTLLSTLLQTKAGYDAIRGQFHDSFTQVIESRVRQLEGEEQSEEREHELRQIADLHSRVQTFEQSYPSTTARENHRLANPDNSSNATVAAAAEPTVLMIAPPPLEASSEAP